MAKKQRMVTAEQAEALAELYVWDTVVSILEGSTAPRSWRGQAAASRVIKSAKQEIQRLIAIYDKEPK